MILGALFAGVWDRSAKVKCRRVTLHFLIERFKMANPICPMPFALHIGREIREKVSQIPGLQRVEVMVQGHLQTDEINATLAKET